MNVFKCKLSNEFGKFQGIIDALPNIWRGNILDVGCRHGYFRQVLHNCNIECNYYGIDLYFPAKVIGDLETGLPFSSKVFEVVIALDVLEHTNDIHRTFSELCRVAKNHIVLTLPNVYEARNRLRFLLGQPLSAKYGLPSDPPRDRHRWLFSTKEAENFTHNMSEKTGFEILIDGCLIGPRRGLWIGRGLTNGFPNLFSQWYLALLHRKA